MSKFTYLFKKICSGKFTMFFILFLFIFQFVFIFDASIVSSEITTEISEYVLTDNINNKAYEGSDGGKIFADDNALFSYQERVNVSYDDEIYVSDLDYLGGNEDEYQYHRFEFIIDEDVSDITQIDITWKGYGGGAETGGAEQTGGKTGGGGGTSFGMYDNQFYYGHSLWLKNQSVYTKMNEGIAQSKQTLSAQINSGFSEIINNDKIYFVARSNYAVDTSTQRNSFILSFYAEVKVTYTTGSLDSLDVSNPSSVIENESFTVTVTSGGIAVENAEIEFVGETYYTDEDGTALVKAPLVDSDISHNLYVTSEGYADATSSILVLDNGSSSDDLLLQIASVPSVLEGDSFDVKVADGNGTPVDGATVEFLGEPFISDNGWVTLVAPLVLSDSYFDIAASLEGYVDGSAQVLVLNNESSPADPELVVSCPVSVFEEESFDVAVTSEGSPVSGVSVVFDDTILETDSSGIVGFVAPLVDSRADYSVVASKDGFVSDSVSISVFDSSSTDVVLSYPVGGETLSGVVDVLWGVVNPPAVNIGDPSSSASFSLWYKPVDGYWTSVVSDLVLSSTIYSWDTTGVDDGVYFLKVLLNVDDVLYEDTSGSFTIDNVEELDDGWIDGAVYYTKGGVETPLSDVTVCVRDLSKSNYQDNKCKFTDQNGKYTIKRLPGFYTISASKQGYNIQTYENIEIQSGEITNINFTLEKTDSAQTNTYIDYTFDQEIKKGSIFGKIDVSAEEDEVFIYDDVDVNVVSSDILSKEGVNLVLSGEGTPGTKLVIYLGVVENPEDLLVEYDGFEINHTTNFQEFFEVGYNKTEYVTTTFSDSEGVKNTVLILNIAHYSEHTIQISLEGFVEALSKTSMLIVYVTMIIISAIGVVIHMKTIWKK